MYCDMSKGVSGLLRFSISQMILLDHSQRLLDLVEDQ